MRALLGEYDDRRLGLGRHLIEAQQLPSWRETATPASVARSVERFAPYMAEDHPGGVDGLRAMASREQRLLLQHIEPRPAPPVWVSTVDFVHGELPPSSVGYVATRHRGRDGTLVGTSLLYSSPLPATVLSLVARGDEGMFARMAELFEPGRRSAAVLFADLEASGALSRQLPSAAYFRLIRAITTAIDGVVVRRGGIVSKHAGDGVTGFFLGAQLGSDSAAARACVEAAVELSGVAQAAALATAAASAPVRTEDCRLNVGAHWGGFLYMGQIVTGGRLEVTALGDEVNECARVEQSARGGAVLGSTALLERLDEEGARAIGLDLDALSYRTVSELSDAGPKAIRDAGTLAVTDLRRSNIRANIDATRGSSPG